MSLGTFQIAPLAALLVLATAAPALGQSQVISTESIGPTADDLAATGGIHVDVNFGAAVALSGRTAAIGIPHQVENPDPGPGPGRVGIYTNTGAHWIRTATLLPSNASDIHFGRDVDVCGNLLVVAAENSTYVFRRRGVHWREIERIGLPSPDSVLGPVVCSNDSFAQSVSRRNDEGELISATVHVYEQRGGGDFELVAKLRASDPNDSIGRSLAMERGVLVAGSTPDAAYVFVRHGRRWIERQKLQGTGANGGGIGAAVAIRDRIIIAGAPEVETSDEPFSGLDGDAFVYLPHRGSWFESQTLNNPPLPGLRSSGHFGSAVAMGRRLVAVAAPFTSADEIRPQSAVIVLDRVGEEFTFARPVYGAGFDGDTIPDIDMSGRRLILSRHESRNPNVYDRVIGRAVIMQFEASHETATQTDEEEADEP
jgi:hypothetical protein